MLQFWGKLSELPWSHQEKSQRQEGFILSPTGVGVGGALFFLGAQSSSTLEHQNIYIPFWVKEGSQKAVDIVDSNYRRVCCYNYSCSLQLQKVFTYFLPGEKVCE